MTRSARERERSFATESTAEAHQEMLAQLFELGVSALRTAFAKQQGISDWQRTYPARPDGLPRIVTRAQAEVCEFAAQALFIGEILDEFIPLDEAGKLLWVNAMRVEAQSDLADASLQIAEQPTFVL